MPMDLAGSLTPFSAYRQNVPHDNNDTVTLGLPSAAMSDQNTRVQSIQTGLSGVDTGTEQTAPCPSRRKSPHSGML
jgi:hypothetical protein